MVKFPLSTVVPVFNKTPKLMTMKFGISKLETLLYRMVWKVFRYLEQFRCDSRVQQTDTDYYVGRPKTVDLATGLSVIEE